MCGIAGWLSWERGQDAPAFARMVGRLAHRGPDAEAIVQRGPIWLGHRRLSIIDVSAAANQPMSDHTERYWIVYNGELYNFRALRAELAARGAQFCTQSDTEVILEAYKAWGEACLQKFNGMFALAIWDEAEQKLWLARDRIGEKPLFYVELSDGIAFASELPALLRHPACCREVETGRLGAYVMLGYGTGTQTLFRDIRRLGPAHTLTVQRSKPLQSKPYWNLAEHFLAKRGFASEAQATEELRALIDDSVKLRLESDVPLGAFLSGGIDSSAIVASMVRHLPREQVHAFTMGFEENGFDETRYAKQVAGHLGVQHHTANASLGAEAIIQSLEIAAADPLADTSIVPTALLCAFTRQHVKVALSGDGGDECFAGYETYVADRLHRALRHTPSWLVRAAQKAAERAVPVQFQKVGMEYKLRQFLSGLLLSPPRAHYSWRTLFAAEEHAALFRPEWQAEIRAHDPFAEFTTHFEAVKGVHPLDQASYVDMKTWLADDILVKVDRASMAHGLESRAPFLDHRLVEFAAQLPVNYKLRGFTKKHVLKQSQVGRLPPEIIHRKKSGFNAPVAHWVAGPLKDFAYALLTDKVLMPYFQPAAIDKLWKDHQNHTRDNGFKILSLACLALWLKRNIS